MTDLSNPIFNSEKAARRHLEKLRWADGRFCPHCGETEKTSPMKGKSHREGLYYCLSCKKQFSVTIGTIFERSHIPLHKWVAAFHLLTASKKGMSAHQLHRMLGVTYKTAWFMAHRIRECMRDDNSSPLGGPGKAVQADETYSGKVEKPRTMTTRGQPFTKSGKTGPANKRAVVALVEPGGRVRSFNPEKANSQTVRKILVTNVSRESELHTDESRLYTRVGREFAGHKKVTHVKGQYVGPSGESTNAVENYFSIFKRGMKGVYQHCREKHLHRYLAEFDFRYNNRKVEDAARASIAIKQASGKRLTYRRID